MDGENELLEYLSLRKQAEDYYQSHPKLIGLVKTLNSVAPDKFGVDGSDLAKKQAVDFESAKNWGEIKNIEATWQKAVPQTH